MMKYSGVQQIQNQIKVVKGSEFGESPVSVLKAHLVLRIPAIHGAKTTGMFCLIQILERRSGFKIIKQNVQGGSDF